MIKIYHSHSLPYYGKKQVSFFDAETGVKITVPKNRFKDVTGEGGRFHQFYSYTVKPVRVRGHRRR